MRPVIRFEGVAGEFCQHDFGQHGSVCRQRRGEQAVGGRERVSATVKARDARRPQFDVKFETAGVKYLDTSPEASPPSVTAPHTVVETLRRSPASADSLRP